MDMNAEIFEEIDYYFKQSLNLIVYAYRQIKKDKSGQPYSRRFIYQTILKVRKSSKSHNEVEDYLRNDLVNGYLRKFRKLFNLDYFSIQAGVEESKQNVSTGIVDIRFEYTSTSSIMDGTAFIFECKRINKYAKTQHAYIKDGMMRFVSGQYYPEDRMLLAGMIAFVEVDLDQNPGGYLPIDKVAGLIKQKIDKENSLRTSYKFSLFQLTHKKYSEVSDFKYSYLSKHIRDEDNREISIHHLLLDYYNILVS
jgi:hypothetical protein